MTSLMKRGGVIVVDADMCRFGLTLSDEIGQGPVKKPMRFITNSIKIAAALNRRC